MKNHGKAWKNHQNQPKTSSLIQGAIGFGWISPLFPWIPIGSQSFCIDFDWISNIPVGLPCKIPFRACARYCFRKPVPQEGHRAKFIRKAMNSNEFQCKPFKINYKDKPQPIPTGGGGIAKHLERNPLKINGSKWVSMHFHGICKENLFKPMLQLLTSNHKQGQAKKRRKSRQKQAKAR